MARNWPALGMNFGHQISASYNADQVTADLTYLYGIGIRKIRLALNTFPQDGVDTLTTTRLKATAIQAMSMGFYVVWGFTASGGIPVTATVWGLFKTYVTGSFLTWAIANNLSEMQVGNEEESHADGSTLTMATVRSDVETMAGTIKGSAFTGKVSYSSETNNSNITNWAVPVNLDYLHFNVYGTTDGFSSTIASIKRKFQNKGAVSEWGSAGGGFPDYPTELDFYYNTLTRLRILKDSNMKFAYFFCYRDGGFGLSTDVFALKLSTGATRMALNVIANNLIRKPLYKNVANSVVTSGTNVITVASNSSINFTNTGTYTWMGRFRMYQQTRFSATVALSTLVFKASDNTSGFQIVFNNNKFSFQERKTFTSWSTTDFIPESMLNKWIDWCVTYDGTGQVIHFYIDGVEKLSQIGSFSWANVVSNTTNGMTFGKGATTENATGAHNDMLMFSRVLTRDEISNFSLGIIPATPQVYIKGDDTLSNGTTLVDSSGNGNTVSISASSMWSSVVSNQLRFLNRDFLKSLSFNGTTDYATLPITPTTAGWSIGWWMYLPKIDSAFGRIFSYADASNNGLRVFYNTLATRVLTCDSGNAAFVSVSSPTGSLLAGEWHHWVFTNDGVKSKLYKDRKLVGYQSSATYANPVSQTFTIGRDSKSSANFCKVLLDEIVFKPGTPLTQTEIDDLYLNATLPTGATCYIKADDSVTDQSGNGNDMTLNGTTYSTNVKSKARLAATNRQPI